MGDKMTNEGVYAINRDDFVSTPFGTARVIAAHLYTLNVKFLDGAMAGKEKSLLFNEDIKKIDKKEVD